MRLVIAHLVHESNSFSPVRTSWESFGPAGPHVHTWHEAAAPAEGGPGGGVRECVGDAEGALEVGQPRPSRELVEAREDVVAVPTGAAGGGGGRGGWGGGGQGGGGPGWDGGWLGPGVVWRRG